MLTELRYIMNILWITNYSMIKTSNLPTLVRKKALPMRKWSNIGVPSLEILKTWLSMSLSNLVKVVLVQAWVCTRWSLQAPFKLLCDSMTGMFVSSLPASLKVRRTYTQTLKWLLGITEIIGKLKFRKGMEMSILNFGR